MLARPSRRIVVAAMGAFALVMGTASPGVAAPGDLDLSFDGDGKVTTDVASLFDQGLGVAIQGDGKIVAVGRTFISGDDDFALTRYNTDGSLDVTFDGDGKVTTDFAGTDDVAEAVAIQTDGKIVAAGCTDCVTGAADFAVARYKTDGSLDPTFDGDGKVTTDFAVTDDAAEAVAIQGDGKIVAAGLSFSGMVRDFALARYNPDGSLDPTFDTDGKVVTDYAGGDDEAGSVVIQADGRIVAGGRASLSGNQDFALARYNINGSLDPTFDGDGLVTTDFASGLDEADEVALQGNGKIVAAGFATISGTFEDVAVARYNVDGSPDNTFDTDGRVTTDFAGSTDEGNDVAIQTDGRIVTAGIAFVAGTTDFAVARYRTDGSLDTIFGGGDGKVTTDFASDSDEAEAMALQADGKIVAAGTARIAGNDDFALARYTVCRRTSRPTTAPCP